MSASKHPTHKIVREAYGKIVSKGGTCCGSNGCCGSLNAAEVALGLGYSEAELATLPEGANLGLSCGNPMAMAALQPGETVLDLGSGAGFDAFLAAQRVGPTGKVHGVDMTLAMVEKARNNALAFQKRTGLGNVEFHHGQIEALPLPDACVDVVLSNCVLNLSPDQPTVWKEIARVLKPGARVSISDMVLFKPLPEALRQSVEALVGCIAGAPLLEDLRKMMEAVGLVDIQLTPKEGAVAAMLQSEDAPSEHIQAHLPEGSKLEDFIASFIISARKTEKFKDKQ